MPIVPFTRNYADNSTEQGFQFTFYCDICRAGFKTKFIPSRTYQKGRTMSAVGAVVGMGLGRRVGDALSDRYEGKTPEWRKEYEEAFQQAQTEAQAYFKRCPRCMKWVCPSDWNEQSGLCVRDAPKLSVEAAAAKAAAQKEEVWRKAEAPVICSACGKPGGTGKFCNNCGAPLMFVKCPKCGAESKVGTKFCGECGTKLL